MVGKWFNELHVGIERHKQLETVSYQGVYTKATVNSYLVKFIASRYASYKWSVEQIVQWVVHTTIFNEIIGIRNWKRDFRRTLGVSISILACLSINDNRHCHYS